MYPARGGPLAVLQLRTRDVDHESNCAERVVPIKALHKMSEVQIKREAAAHALLWDRTVGTLPRQHLVVFRKRDWVPPAPA